MVLHRSTIKLRRSTNKGNDQKKEPSTSASTKCYKMYDMFVILIKKAVEISTAFSQFIVYELLLLKSITIGETTGSHYVRSERPQIDRS